MLNVLNPTTNLPLATSSFSRRTQDRSRAGSHPPVADGSGRRGPPSSLYLDGISRMGYPGPMWVGNVHPNGIVGPTHNLPASNAAQVSSKDALLNLPQNAMNYPAVPSASHPIANPPSAAPPAQYQPSSPVHAPEFEAIADEDPSDANSNQIVSYLQIPPSINDSKGSLSDFAAQITCLFWFESSFTLHRVEEAPHTPTPAAPLVDETKPCMGFRKWVTTMLSTTQVTQNVILLALLFIYRLKKLNPQVKGKPGSEYRLLTVALMLGNKFLDDNTYTNKTWADVSGIAVAEIHVMEVEFLSNMRYNLYTSDKEWKQWHRKLARFWNYFEKASESPSGPRALPSVALPSPPQSQQASPSFRGYDTVNGSTGAGSHYPVPNLPNTIPRMPEIDLRPASRKRSYDDSYEEPPAKRMPPRTFNGQTQPNRARGLSDGPMPSFIPHSSAMRLPMPAYAPTTGTQAPSYPAVSAVQYSGPRTRAMTMVYGTPQPQGAPMYSSPVGYLDPSNMPHMPISAAPPMPMVSRQGMPSHSATASPTSLAATPNPELLSPAVGYAINRSSPYRPVRTVNTLLVPPPSTSFQNPPLHLGAANMHYQPLGRPMSERRTGVVPFVHHNPQWAPFNPFR